jgi:hypothetical protein
VSLTPGCHLDWLVTWTILILAVINWMCFDCNITWCHSRVSLDWLLAHGLYWLLHQLGVSLTHNDNVVVTPGPPGRQMALHGPLYWLVIRWM